ncbi:hypothetical protein [Roseivirga seohaensis]|uniref:hypothetical protein n=1 Tax=Roseivirga seohaensis TaxID=1914963 RepID=UPI000784152F|nr:hypothetical protein [Roseivirga seohaensis]
MIRKALERGLFWFINRHAEVEFEKRNRERLSVRSGSAKLRHSEASEFSVEYFSNAKYSPSE